MRLQTGFIFFRGTPKVSISLLVTPALRVSTIGVKTLFTLVLAVWLGAADLGRYGLITATISLTVYAYGLDFYTFTVRELSTDEAHKIRQRLRDLFVLFAACYLVGAVILAYTLPRFGFDPALAALTIFLASTQHAGLELYRILVRIERTTEATVCLLLRDAAWMPACLLAGLLLRHLSLSVILCLLAGRLGRERALCDSCHRPHLRCWRSRSGRQGVAGGGSAHRVANDSGDPLTPCAFHRRSDDSCGSGPAASAWHLCLFYFALFVRPRAVRNGNPTIFLAAPPRRCEARRPCRPARRGAKTCACLSRRWARRSNGNRGSWNSPGEIPAQPRLRCEPLCSLLRCSCLFTSHCRQHTALQALCQPS